LPGLFPLASANRPWVSEDGFMSFSRVIATPVGGGDSFWFIGKKFQFIFQPIVI